MIVVVGEALVDLVPSAGSEDLVPRPGGSPANIAVTLGRLGVPSAFCGRVGDDEDGRRILEHLEASSVDTRWTRTGAEPTTKAAVEIVDGEPRFEVHTDGTAAMALRPEDLPASLREARAIVTGSIALAGDPAASTLDGLRSRIGGRVLFVDPNVRPSVVDDRSRYTERLARWIEAADVVHVSTEDLAWLHPERDPADVASSWVDGGVPLVVVTAGRDGAWAYGQTATAAVDAPHVRIVDTVGAGDAFGAGLLAWLHHRALLDPHAIPRLHADDLHDCLTFACSVGALTCGRAGAEPPWADEVEALGS